MSALKPEILVQLRHKAQPFKRILSVLKDLLTDVNILFDRTQVRIGGVDPEKLVVTQLSLLHFEEYSCVEDGIRVGVYISYLHKMLRGVGPDHVIEMTIKRDTPSVLEVTVLHAGKNTRSFTAVRSMDLPLEKIDIPEVEFDAMVTVPMKDMQKALREVGLLSKRVCLGYTNDIVQLISSGPIGVANLAIGPTPDGLVWHKQAREGSHGIYFTKFIEKFVRPDVSDTIDIYFRKSFPLVFQYTDKDYLGVFQFAIAEIEEPNVT